MRARSLAVPFLACAFALAVTGPLSSAQPPYEIDALLGLTGPSAFVGQSQLKTLVALEALVNKQGGINGRPVHFVIQDNQTNPQVTVQLANAVIAKKAPVVLVSGLVASCASMAGLIKDGPVEYCLSPALYPPKDGYVFSSSVATKDLITAMLRYFRDRGLRRVAVITSTDATGQDADRNLADALTSPEAKDVVIVDQEHFAPTDVGVSAQIAKIKAANAQLVIAWTSGTPFGTILRGLKDAGLDVPVATTNGNMTYAQMKQYAGLLPRELCFPAVAFLADQAATPAMRAAQRAYYAAVKEQGLVPDTPSGNAWDPASIVIDALRHVGTNATADQLRQYILQLHGYAGISGIYDFRTGNQRGLGPKDVLVVRWDDAKATWVGVSRFGGAPL